jgi:phosphonate transport system ATP-binding protein
VVLNDLRRAAHELNIAVLCNLHQVEYAREFADHLVGISAGRTVFDGSVAQLDDAALERIYSGDLQAGLTRHRSGASEGPRTT